MTKPRLSDAEQLARFKERLLELARIQEIVTPAAATPEQLEEQRDHNRDHLADTGFGSFAYRRPDLHEHTDPESEDEKRLEEDWNAKNKSAFAILRELKADAKRVAEIIERAQLDSTQLLLFVARWDYELYEPVRIVLTRAAMRCGADAAQTPETANTADGSTNPSIEGYWQQKTVADNLGVSDRAIRNWDRGSVEAPKGWPGKMTEGEYRGKYEAEKIMACRNDTVNQYFWRKIQNRQHSRAKRPKK